MIMFNGITSDSLGVIVEHYPKVVFPERKVTEYEIPGRNGTQIIDQEVYANYDQQYEVFFDVKNHGGLNAALPQIASWLLSGVGYQRLEDSYFPDFYRMAYVSNAHSFLSYFHEYGRGTLTFNCQPERFYKTGEIEVPIQNGTILYNPTGFKSYPVYKIKSTAPTTVTLTSPDFGTRTFKTIGAGADEIIVVKEHTNSITNWYVEADYEDLRLSKQTTITWNGPIQSFTIKPNWWTI